MFYGKDRIYWRVKTEISSCYTDPNNELLNYKMLIQNRKWFNVQDTEEQLKEKTSDLWRLAFKFNTEKIPLNMFRFYLFTIWKLDLKKDFSPHLIINIVDCGIDLCAIDKTRICCPGVTLVVLGRFILNQDNNMFHTAVLWLMLQADASHCSGPCCSSPALQFVNHALQHFESFNLNLISSSLPKTWSELN